MGIRSEYVAYNSCIISYFDLNVLNSGYPIYNVRLGQLNLGSGPATIDIRSNVNRNYAGMPSTRLSILHGNDTDSNCRIVGILEQPGLTLSTRERPLALVRVYSPENPSHPFPVSLFKSTDVSFTRYSMARWGRLICVHGS